MNEKDDALNKSLAAEIGYAFQDLTGFAARIDLENRIVAALTTARKEAREVAFKDAKAALQAPTPGTMASTEFHKGFESMRRLGIRAVEAAANTEEGAGDG